MAEQNEILNGLNDEQRAGVLHTDGPMLIVAGAGSGKTTVLTRRAARLIADGVDPASILIVTFTNKAAGELRERLESLVGPAGNRVVAATFHSFCVRHLMRPYAKAVGIGNFTILDDREQTQILMEAIKALTPEETRILNEYEITQKMISSEMGLARAYGLSPEAYLNGISSAHTDYPLRSITSAAWRIYLQRLEKENAVDFDGILEWGLKILRTYPSALDAKRRQFQQIMVDEFQDTNTIQADIIRLMASPRNNVTVVGDARQSIYRFRGSQIGIIIGFRDEYPGAKILELPVNYRSTGNIVTMANSISEEMKQKVGEREMVAGGGLSAIHVVPTYSEHQTGQEEAVSVADRIISVCDGGASPNEIAVLYRSRIIKTEIENALISAGIPYTVVGDMGFMQRKEIRDFVALLRVVLNPDDGMAWCRMVDAVKPGVSVAALKKLAGQHQISLAQALNHKATGSGKVARRLQEMIFAVDTVRGWMVPYRGQFKQLESAWKTLLFPAVIKAVDTQKRGASKEARQAAINLRKENVARLLSMIEEKLESDISFEEVMEDIMLMADAGDSNQRDTVQIMTIHASKGLEFDHVFLPGLEDEILPGKCEEVDEAEEEKRIFYVAITRAKKSVHLSWVFRRLVYGNWQDMNVSRFVTLIGNHIQEDCDSGWSDCSPP